MEYLTGTFSRFLSSLFRIFSQFEEVYMKLKKSIPFLTIIALLLLAIVACNAPGELSPSPDIGLVVAKTQTAIALQQYLTSTAVSQPTSSQITPGGPGTITTFVPTPTSSPTPTATTNNPACVDKAIPISETILDGTIFSPGESFVKTWTLRNDGSCTWTPDYKLVFTSGERMSGASPTLFGTTVPPNGQGTLSITLIAPPTPGEYQGLWKLSSAAGQIFGTIWVKINILTTPGSQTGLGAPTWSDNFSENHHSWFLGDDGTTNYVIKDGNLVITAYSDTGDQWRVAQSGILDNFYLEGHFITGDACSGKDSFGFIVRAPDQPDSILDTGYIFSISCDGKYRFYRMDNGEFTSLINWTSSPTIKNGRNQNNILGIKAQDFKLQLYINGIMVAELSDASYSSGYFGLVIRSKDTPDFQVAVNEVAYWKLP
jgi:hypothetical protein